MKNEEAIEVLLNGAWWGDWVQDKEEITLSERGSYMELHEALDAAIFSLRAQPENKKNEPSSEWFFHCPVCGKPFRITPAKDGE